MRPSTTILTGIYLFAIVVANLLIAAYGPAAALFNAAALIGLDLTARDALHEAWRGRGLWIRMLALIAAGSVLSWLLSPTAGRIALASFVAFASAGAADALIYAALGQRARLLRINGSNVVSASVDSVVFVLLAGLPAVLIPGQVAAKIAGGLIWSIVLFRFRFKEVPR